MIFIKLYLKIKEIRQKKGLTQKELADKMDISEQMISYYENSVKYPSLERAIQIAIALDVSMDDLIDMDRYISDYHEELFNIGKKDNEI